MKDQGTILQSQELEKIKNNWQKNCDESIMMFLYKGLLLILFLLTPNTIYYFNYKKKKKKKKICNPKVIVLKNDKKISYSSSWNRQDKCYSLSGSSE